MADVHMLLIDLATSEGSISGSCEFVLDQLA